MKIFIEPVDVLLFRDGKPFSAGDDHQASSLSSPLNPYTFQGALRSRILADFEFNHEIARKIIGDSSSYGKLTYMKGPFLAKKKLNNIEEYFPVPADLACSKSESTKKELLILSPLDKAKEIKWQFDHSAYLSLLWANTADRLESCKGFISRQEINKYLSGDVPEIIRTEEFFEIEPRMGIRRSTSTHTSEEGQLYNIGFLRLKQDTGFTIEMEGLPLKKQGMLMLGGESRAARYEESSVSSATGNFSEKIKESIKAKRRFKIYLSTPAFFQKGWLPSTITPDTGKGNIKGIEVELIAAAINWPLSLGGWDLLNRKPKSIEKLVPAGSVFYFNTIETDVEKIFNSLDFQSISDKYCEIGSGLSFIGGW